MVPLSYLLNMPETNAEWSVIAEYTNHPIAELSAGLLEEHGIPAYLWSDDAGGLLAGSTFVDRVRLFVPNYRSEDARGILAARGVEDPQ